MIITQTARSHLYDLVPDTFVNNLMTVGHFTGTGVIILLSQILPRYAN